MSFVLDASMMLSWHFADELTEGRLAVADRTIEELVVVPSHWLAEVANGVLIGERRGRSLPAQTTVLLEKIKQMEIEVDDIGGADPFFRLLPLARAHRLTVYDAGYLELAERRGLPIATLDVELAQAARTVGLEVLDGEGR